MISESVNIPSEFYFRYDFLQIVIQQLHDEIEKLLDKSLVVTLVPDIWEKNFDHRLGLGAILTFDSFERQLLIIGIEIIESSNAEKIKLVTESIVNNYKFDKHKIKGMFEAYINFLICNLKNVIKLLFAMKAPGYYVCFMKMFSKNLLKIWMKKINKMQ